MKSTAKIIMDVLARCLSTPFFVLYLLLTLFVGRRRAFGSVMQTLSLFPGITGEWIRRGGVQWITRCRLVNVCISFGTLFSDPEICIGSGVYIGPRCDIGKATIGEDTIIGSQVHITSGRHQHWFDRTDIPIRDQGGRFERIHIGKDTWIGNGAIICANVGNGCVIGAGSLVIKPVPDGSLVAGDSVRAIRHRS